MKKKLIEIQRLKKSYGEEEALAGIDLSIEEGSLFGVIGMSGAGKSTLIRCLTCLESPSGGKILLDGEDLPTLSAKELRARRKKIGMIFQQFNLFSSRTALENIWYPLEIEGGSLAERKKRAEELLALVALEGKGGHYPSQLSGGEKQRVAIARALANGPELLLCDEATSSLDPQTTQAILSLLLSLNQKLGLTILLITHEMEVIKQICTHVAVLEGGEVVEQGEVADLFAAPKHPTTRRFLQNLPHEIPEKSSPAGEMFRLTFKGSSAKEPVISRLIREHAVEVNILAGGIDILVRETVGTLVVELTGEEQERAKARLFLEGQGVVCDAVE